MEQVNHPSHYNIEGKKECIEEMRDNFGTYITAIFCLTNCYKYLYRAGHKVGTDDIAKARWYWDYANQDINCMYYFINSAFRNLYIAVEEMLHDKSGEC